MKGFTKKKILNFIAVVFFIVTVIVGAVIFNSRSDKEKIPAEELSRMLSYDQLADDKTYYVNDQGESTEECEFVKFESYYTADLDGDGYAEKMLGSCKEIGKTDTLYINIAVEQEGYLKDAVITLNGTNVAYSMKTLKDSIIKDNCVFSNVKSRNISLNKMDAGINKLLTAITSSSISSADNYSATNKVTLTGIYVDTDDVEHTIKKEIEFTNDWYGKAKSELYNLSNYIDYSTYVDSEDKSISFSFSLREIYKELIPQYASIQLDIPEIAGEYPQNVISPNGTYNPDTHILTIINNTTSFDGMYTVKLEYSDEVYNTITTDDAYMRYTMIIPVSAYYACNNNPSEEFSNPYITDTVSSRVYVNFEVNNAENANYIFSVAFLNTESVKKPNSDAISSFLSKKTLLKIYEQNTSEDLENMVYTTAWQVRKKLPTDTGHIIEMKDTQYSEYQKYGDQISGYWLEDYAEIKQIFFRNNNFISSDQYVSVYNNDTNELIKKFTYAELNSYNSSINAYKLDSGIKHIRVETSRANQDVGALFNVYMEKEIDSNKIKNNFTKAQIENMQQIKTTIRGGGTLSNVINYSATCGLETEKNYAKISLNKDQASTLEKLNERIYIDVPSANTIYSQWKNGIFLVEVPSQIINMKINDITSNNTGLKIEGYELYKDHGKYFIKIITSSKLVSGFRITIDCDMNIDPRTATTTVPVNLYAYNENTSINFYSAIDSYDINGNGNTTESVAFEKTNLNLFSQAAFVSVETLTNFDDEESIIVAPNIADINTEVRDATVNVEIVNNFSQNVENISILGKIPFEGNTFIGGNSLGSKFTTTMKDTGITVQDELKNYVNVYYSTKENPNKDLTDTTNEWTLAESVASFENIKSYLIVLDNYTLKPGYGYEFSYDINIPENVNINDTSYSCHIVYYDLVTDGGIVSYSVQPSKLGIRIVDYFDLELHKVKENTDLGIQGATYLVTEVLPENADPDLAPETKISVSASDGTLKFSNLRINQEYTLKEIKAPGNYELSELVRKFKLVQNSNGTLELVTDNNFDGDVTISRDSEGKVVVESKVEDVPKVGLTITKIDKDTNEPMKGVVFIINGIRYVTNAQGKLTVDGISFGQTSTIKESYAKGYYVDNTEYEFTVNKDSNNNVVVTSTNEAFTNATITNSDEADLVGVAVALTNEKIPTYNLKVIKVDASNVEQTLEGARFVLRKEDDGNSEVITTDADGKITVQNLYQFVEGKNITGKYVLQETQAPSGYSNNKEEIKFFVYKNENNEFQVSFENNESVTLSSAEFQNNTLVLTIKDKPLFKVKKTDKTTGVALANAEFVIYKLDSNGNVEDYAKDGNGEYIGSLNDKEQYVVITDNNGYITAPLPDGSYKIIEVKAPEGYALYGGAEIFTITEGNKWTVESVEEDPVIEIYTVEDLVDFSNSANNRVDYYNITVKLMNDLDIASDNSYEDPNADYGDINGDGVNEGLKAELTNTSGKGFTPIGTNQAFMGIFDGQCHSISNLYIKSSNSSVGFFGATNSATIKNFGISSGNIIVNCSSEACIGGIIGYASSTAMYNCYNKTVIEAHMTNNNTLYIGGIVGRCDYSSYIENCYNRGNIIATTTSSYNSILSGGISGYYGTIKNCYTTGNISLSGAKVYASPISYSGTSRVSNSYYLNSVTISGLVSDGSISKTSEEMKTTDFVTLLGIDNWKMDENSSNNDYPILKTYNEQKIERVTEIYTIEDLVDLSNQISSGVDYTECEVKLMNDLDFNAANSYNDTEVTTYGDLNQDGNITGIKDELTAENGIGFTPIGDNNNTFKGIFDGQGHEIKNLYINNNTLLYIGLFGFTEKANIMNLCVSGNIYSSTYCYAGGISGFSYNNSLIINCISKVNINITIDNTNVNSTGGKTISVGGIAGAGNRIYNCYNIGNITVEGKYTNSSYEYHESIAGIAPNTSPISNCYNRGNLESKSKDSNFSGTYSIAIAGISTNCAVSNSYTTGNILYDESTVDHIRTGCISSSQTVDNCYYLDSAQINKTFEDNSVAKDSAYMKTQDFVNLLGSSNWSLDTKNVNSGYPVLKTSNIKIITEINCIEDLEELSNEIDMGIIYSKDTTIKLNKTLDFNEDSSYNNPEDTKYGDLNGDGNITGIKDELTDTNGKGFTPIGNNTYFTCNFDGQGYSINNIYINRNNSMGGFFGIVKDATISNLSISGNMNLSSESGGICGTSYGKTTIENCNNYCNISCGSNSGGIVGYSSNFYAENRLKIKNCNNYGTITTTNYGYRVGGILGEITSASLVEIENCNNYVDITGGSDSKGGILGYGYSCRKIKISNCINDGKIESNSGSTYDGGIVGYIDRSTSVIKDCSNSGMIIYSGSGYAYLGGIIGNLWSASLSIYNCNNSGSITTTQSTNSSYIGGIIGKGTAEIQYCYNTAAIGNSNSYVGYAGGIGGYLSGKISDCYNLGNITNAERMGGIIGGDNTYILNSYNEGKIEANSNFNTNYSVFAGGIAGNNGTRIENCNNIAEITISENKATSKYIGGILGSGYGRIQYCFNRGNIVSTSNITNSYTNVTIGGISGGYSTVVSYCYNTGNITTNYTSKGTYLYIGGIASDGSVTNCYNTGNISNYHVSDNSTNSVSMYIAGIVGSAKAETNNCYNTGIIKNESYNSNYHSDIYVGGIVATTSYPVNICYNTGDLENKSVTAGSYGSVRMGGIAGATNSSSVVDAYNTGSISNDVTPLTPNAIYDYVGGILGVGSNVIYSYNTGNVVNNVRGTYKDARTGAVIGNGSLGPRYYLESIDLVGPNIVGVDNTTRAVSDEELKSEEIFEALNYYSDWTRLEGAYPILDIPVYTVSDESAVEITIQDEKLEYDITAEVGENINGVRIGGNVSGAYNDKYLSLYNRKYIETVSYNENSTEAITITPNPGYEVIGITINGENYSYEPDTNGVVTIPAGYFENVKNNYNVIAKFGLSSEVFTINKVDENNNPVKDAVFEVHEIDTREAPTGVIGDVVQDGQAFSYIGESTDEILGTLTNNGTYYFSRQADGTLKSNNKARNTTADSYMKIDLTDSSKNYYIQVNYSNTITSSNRCYGMVAVTNNTTALTTSSSTGRFVYSNYSTTNAISSYSAVLQPGNIYYLHIAQTNGTYNLSSSEGFVINSINIYEQVPVQAYSFENVDGKYVSNNNQTLPVSTYATCYVPVDLRGVTGKYNIVINSEISGQNHVGYITVNNSTSRTTSGYSRSGTMPAANYSTMVEGGQMYYVHLTHNNYGSTTAIYDNNTFTINSITVTLNGSDLKNITGILTDAEGKAKLDLNYGKYAIFETRAPEGYTKSDETKLHVIGEGTNNNVTFVNQTKKKVVSHYYLKNTGEQYNVAPVILSEDETTYGDLGEDYSTNVYTELKEYKLLTQDGEYVIPDNATGKYQANVVNVYYYYEMDKSNYKVHYYYGDEEDENALIEEEADIGSKITTYQDKAKTGYKFKETINLPLTVSANANNNNIYVMYEKDEFNYTVKYYYEDENGEYQENQSKQVTNSALFGSQILEYEDKVIDGYKLNRAVALNESGEETALPLIITADSSKNIIKVYYERDYFDYTVHYFYNDVENKLMKTTNQAKLGSKISSQDVEDKCLDGYRLVKMKRLDANNQEQDLPLTITTDTSKNVINVYYKTLYNISTAVVEHSESYSTGETTQVKGGTISGESDDIYETVLKGDNSTKNIQITPNEGYKIVNIKIKNGRNAEDTANVDFSDMIDENGIVTLTSENGYFKNMQSDKHIEVEFRKKSSVIVKYLEKDTEAVLATEETIEGYESQEITTSKKVVTNYMSSDPELTDENGTEKTSTVIITGDAQTRIYWYERIPAGIIVRKIAITEEDIENGLTIDSGTEISSTLLEGFVSLQETITRESVDKCISKDGPVSTNENIIIAGKDDNSITVTYTEDEVVEVRFYYERLYDITLETKEHTENRTGTEEQVKGGHIEGEDTVPYEQVPAMGSNEKEIVIVPDSGYRVKTIEVNETAIDLTVFTEGANHVITIPTNYFTKVQEEKTVQVEFERIPAKVIVENVDVDTNEVISREVAKTGTVGDSYEIDAETIDYYRLVETPNNTSGTMTEDDIVVTFKYKRIFKITTKVVLHDEVLRPKITLPKDSDQAVTSIQVKGGTISGEDDDIYESVDRGENSTKDIEVIADENYKIVSLTKNGNDMDITNETGFMIDKFNDIQEDIEIAVKYEKLKFWLTVKYLDKATNEAIANEEKVEGYINEQYETKPKTIDGYEYVETEGEAEGTLVEDTTIKYYYNKKVVPPPAPGPEVKDAIVIIEYTDVDTGEVIEDDTVYEGKVGDKYDVRDKVKEIPGYKPTEAPKELQGTINKEKVVIVYYYKKIQNMPVVEEKGQEPTQIVEEVVEHTPRIEIEQVQVVNKGMKTGDNIIWTFITLISSSIVLVVTVIKKIR